MWDCISKSNEHVEDVCHEMTNKEQVLGTVVDVFPLLWQSLIIWRFIGLLLQDTPVYDRQTKRSVLLWGCQVALTVNVREEQIPHIIATKKKREF
jgi:hypothetical protein